MKRLVAISVLLALCSSLYATGPIDLTQDQIATLRLCLASLASQLARLSAAVETENIGPELRGEISRTIELMFVILEALGYTRRLPGAQG